MDNKVNQIIAAVFMVVISFLLGFSIADTILCPKIELINAYDAYNRDCEILLDSIASWNDSFMDITGETDAYYNYIESRKKLDSIIYSEDPLY